ncbi:MAG: molybdenum cofactor guanylyltransferase MobA [Halocynthiibacter sp.]
MNAPLGVILAGGQARRMGGGDKGLLMLANQSLLSRVHARLLPQVEHIALNANGDAARFQEFGMPVLADTIEGFAGPLAGVLAGLDWAAEIGASHIVTAAADTPFFPVDLVSRLLSAAKDANTQIALAASHAPERGPLLHPTFGLWPVALRSDLRSALVAGLRKVVLWTDQHGAASASFACHRFDPFFNVNTQADLTEAESLLKEGAI